MSTPKPPRGLSAEARRLWISVNADFVLDAASASLLLVALEALARLREAQAAVAEHGLLIPGARGGLRTNPALAIENQSRQAFLAALKQLNFDAAPEALSPHARAAENARHWRNG